MHTTMGAHTDSLFHTPHAGSIRTIANVLNVLECQESKDFLKTMMAAATPLETSD